MGCVQTVAYYYVQHLLWYLPAPPWSDGMYRQGSQVLPGYMWHLGSLPLPALPCLMSDEPSKAQRQRQSQSQSQSAMAIREENTTRSHTHSTASSNHPLTHTLPQRG